MTFVMMRMTLKWSLTGIRAIHSHPSLPIINQKSASPVKRGGCSETVSLFGYPGSRGLHTHNEIRSGKRFLYAKLSKPAQQSVFYFACYAFRMALNP